MTATVKNIKSQSDQSFFQNNIPAFGFIFYTLFAMALILFLSIGKAFFLPLVIAVLFWYLIHILRSFVDGILLKICKCHTVIRYLSFLISILLFIVVLYKFALLLNTNMSLILKDADTNQAKFVSMITKFMHTLKIKAVINQNTVINFINIKSVVEFLLTSLSSLVANAGMVFVYLIFIFVEQKCFGIKLEKVVKNNKTRQQIWDVLRKIDRNMKMYITVKTGISFATATVAYFIMQSVGLQYSAFWGLLLFIMNYIPTFGSIISSILPMIFAVSQFESMLPIAIVCVGLILTQFFFGNYLEPKILGRTLNLSPLVIIISLVIWGMIWGVVGMFLCVPIMSLVMAALSAIPSTQKIAILLSEGGEIVK